MPELRFVSYCALFNLIRDKPGVESMSAVQFKFLLHFYVCHQAGNHGGVKQQKQCLKDVILHFELSSDTVVLIQFFVPLWAGLEEVSFCFSESHVEKERNLTVGQLPSQFRLLR